MGHLKDNIITCPMLGARFDTKTGKKLSDPVYPSLDTASLPSNLQKYMQQAGQLMSHIKTYDQKRFQVRVEGNSPKVKI
jgi:nitrite reductase/ring-hydroxylating ferredoxin subunit